MRFAVDRPPKMTNERRVFQEATGDNPPVSCDTQRVQVIFHPGFREAKDQILAELFNNQRMIVITGAAGTGKTTLLQEIARILHSAGWHVTLGLNGNISVPQSKRPSNPAVIPIAVLLDGVGHVSPSQLQRILRLQDVAVVLALPPGLEQRFPTNSPIRLAPLSAEEGAEYVNAWLGQNGHAPGLLNREALARLLELSAGIPRVLSSLLHQSVRGGDAQLSTAVPVPEADDAASKLTLPHMERANKAASTAIAARQHNPAQSPTPTFSRGPQRFVPAGLTNAVLAGILCFLGMALIGFMLLDMFPVSRDDMDPPPGVSTRPAAGRSP